jgi:hypothetical protein
MSASQTVSVPGLAQQLGERLDVLGAVSMTAYSIAIRGMVGQTSVRTRSRSGESQASAIVVSAS